MTFVRRMWSCSESSRDAFHSPAPKIVDCGSWTYQSDVVNFLVEKEEIDLGDFYDNQEWLLMDARLRNGTTRSMEDAHESVSMVSMKLILKRQSFYYVFNLVFPTTLVSLVAVIGFHAPINATGRRESKFRLGIMTLLSMSVMLLMLVGEMKFAMESVPGKRGSFSDVPLLDNSSINLLTLEESRAWRHEAIGSLKGVNFTEVNTDAPLHGEVLLEAHPGASGKVDVIIALLREVISVKQTHHRNQQLRSFWERIIKRLETVSLYGYLSLIAINFTMIFIKNSAIPFFQNWVLGHLMRQGYNSAMRSCIIVGEMNNVVPQRE
ncbi:hypothetical protein NECAME_14641 [Necator americanus]|uniref:Neurotransmitter-gated ion-channel ligand-binding domain-containing protein n=1 Tax=Necator americanus TaxID=51031 RepID=W2SLX7_NECAM|nr:hypothetical protein NECAME_14641 [Necator americanus]ETN70630.1 hypothetical protein NECAME_14641 [Necator americanus]